jgi:transposase
MVTLTKQAHIQLVHDAHYWKWAHHQRAIVRAERLAVEHQRALEQVARREATLRSERDAAWAKIRDLQQRVFGRKSERSSAVDTQLLHDPKSSRSRGQQRGAPGHGRTIQPNLPTRTEIVEIDSPQCPGCGLPLSAFPGTDDSEVLEIEVKAYRRVIHRRRYRPTCQCGCLPGIVTAPPPARLIAKGKLGVSVWVSVLLDKFLYGRPSYRLLQDLSDQGLSLSPGTLSGGLQAIAPLFAPLQSALVTKLRSEAHWHADETRWEVFVEVEGKVGHRWYLWVFQSSSVVHYVLDPSRSAAVPAAELADVQTGVLSCDRYVAYRKLARQRPGIVLAYCWAHQRRDFLKLANDYPDLSAWALGWVGRIGELYQLHALRREAGSDWTLHAARTQQLQRAVQRMASQYEVALTEATLAAPAVKVLKSMKKHWPGLTVCVEYPGVPMDNNAAERALRPAVVARKNFYGSGSQWSGQLTATMLSVLMTAKLWQLNARTWLSAYLQACAEHGNQAPPDVSAFLPWAMDAKRFAEMRSPHLGADQINREEVDTS